MAESSGRLPLGLRLFFRNASQPRFLIAFLNFGTAILLETTVLNNSTITRQFARVGSVNEVAHIMAIYFLLTANVAILPVISDRVPDLMRHWYGVGLTLSPVFVYSLFGLPAAFLVGALMPLWWVAWVFILLVVIFARGLK